APARLARGCGGLPHAGQAVRWAAAAGVKRIRQLVQQTCVMADPFRRRARAFVRRAGQSSVLAWQAASARWAVTVHHRIVQLRVASVEVHPVAPAAEDPQDVSALTAIFTPAIDDCRDPWLL